MSKQCPVCNFTLKDHDEDEKEQYISVHCHECGNYKMRKDCAKDFRRKFLCFDISTVGGRELYAHNLRLVRSYLGRHHYTVINDAMIHDIVGIYLPRQ